MATPAASVPPFPPRNVGPQFPVQLLIPVGAGALLGGAISGKAEGAFLGAGLALAATLALGQWFQYQINKAGGL